MLDQLLLWALQVSVVVAAAPSPFSLYAYGRGPINGLPVFFADNLAYIGDVAPNNSTVATNISFTTGGSSSRIWYASANTTTNSNVTLSGDPVLYINPDAGPNSQIGIEDASSLPEGALDDGFQWYGSRAMYYNSTADSLQSQFWAELLHINETASLYRLTWNTAAIVFNGTVPVTLKYSSPRT